MTSIAPRLARILARDSSARVVLAKIEFYRLRDQVFREEMALYDIPAWRLFKRARQRTRILSAKVALRVAEAAVAEAERERDAARGAA